MGLAALFCSHFRRDAPRPLPSRPPTYWLAEKALKASDFQTVRELVEQIPETAKEWQAGQLLAGEAAFKAGQSDAALSHYLDAANNDPSTPDGQLALFSAGELHLEIGQLSQAEEIYRRILELQPGNALTNERMAFLLSLTGRRWEALNHYFALIQGGVANYRELALAADVGRNIEEFEFLKKCFERSPEDKLVRLAWAAHAFNEGQPEAKDLLESLVGSSPDLISAQAMLGELLVDHSDKTSFLNWHSALPESAEDSSDIWFVRGLWAGKQSDVKTAADCFWQSVIRTPFHRRAYYVLGRMLVALNDPKAKEIAAYSERLIALSQSIDQVLRSEANDEKAVRTTALLLEQLGRTWETCAWGVMARQRFPQSNWPHELLARHSGKLNDQLAWIEPEKNPAANRPLSSVPEFDRLIAKVSEGLRTEEDGLAPGCRADRPFASTRPRSFPFNTIMPTTPRPKACGRLSRPAAAWAFWTWISTARRTCFFRKARIGSPANPGRRFRKSIATSCFAILTGKRLRKSRGISPERIPDSARDAP